jgi:uncharacterized protein (TIGR02145 family)
MSPLRKVKKCEKMPQKTKAINPSKQSVGYSVLKATKAIIDMPYTSGNILRFTAYSSIFTSIVTDIPVSSKSIIFNFAASLSILTTTAVSSITNSTAISGGYISSDGGASVSARGICYSTLINPTISNNLVNSGSGTGVYVSNLTALTPSTNYYVRAFATNNAGTAYGNQEIFSTLNILPSVSTAPATAITATTATSGGNVISDGGASVTARGICYSNFTNPTISDLMLACGSGTASFTASLTALTANTTYYAKAYAINSIGTAYGNEINFTTLISVPTVITTAASSVSYTTATSGGNIVADGGAIVTVKGICYSISLNPTTADSIISSGSGTAAFTSNISGLTAGTTYFVRAFAANSIGTAYGNLINFTTLQYATVFYDIDGNAYDTVHIGTQIWMKQNLKTTKFRNGDAIPNYISNSTYSNLTTAAYSNYNNDTNTASTYGKLYNWYTVADNRGLCPTGWHVPTDSEFSDLTTYLGGSSFAGGKLKEVGLSHWINPNTGADNSSNFTALPGGVRNSTGNYFSLTYYCYLWSATESTPTYAWYYYLSYNDVAFNRAENNKKLGYSVRCIKDTVASYKVLDVDGNAYDTVQIGTQVWMKQNLKTTKFNNGDALPNYVSNSTYSNLTTAAYSNYNNDTTIANIYGKLYNWFSVSDSRGLCPIGWHVPTDNEFSVLTAYLGGDTIAGGKLKETGLFHWALPNTGADNISGLTALPVGYRNTTGNYFNLTYYCYLWSATESTSTFAWYYYLSYNYASFNRIDNNKKLGHAVRCMKN